MIHFVKRSVIVAWILTSGKFLSFSARCCLFYSLCCDGFPVALLYLGSISVDERYRPQRSANVFKLE